MPISNQRERLICLYLHVHQPIRLTKLNYLELGTTKDYFAGSDNGKNETVLQKVAEKSYLPTNKVLAELIAQIPDFRISLSITGTLIEQLRSHSPKVLTSFKKLVATGKVELLSETYHHSLASMYSLPEFGAQVQAHHELLKTEFDYTPRTFRNTELIYSDRIASYIAALGYSTAIAEGWDPVLAGRSSNHVYYANLEKLASAETAILKQFRHSEPTKELKLLLKNYKLSDDIAFRFSNKDWEEYPLTVEKYLHWLDATPGEVINLFMDYETFGEHQWGDSGIFEFLREFPKAATKRGYRFATISEAAELPAQGTLSVTELLSWADSERDVSAWTGNKLQKSALELLYSLEPDMNTLPHKLKNRHLIANLYASWRRLQTSDHLYYMSTKYWNDGDVHKYFSPYDSPYEAFINYMNILEDFSQRLRYELGRDNVAS